MSEVSSSQTQGLDSQTFLTALVTNAAILAIELIAFIFLKHRLSRIYEPRAYLPPPEKRAIDLPPGPWKWLLAIFAVPTADVLHKNGVDAYMFLRFLRLLIIVFSVLTALTWLILLPIDTVGFDTPNFEDGLARLSWGNIPESAVRRYSAHVVVVYISTFFTLWIIRKELFHFAEMRQAFLISKSHSHLAQARTVLITTIPEEMCSEKELRLWASFVPGGIQNIWIYRDTTQLNKEHQSRLDACNKLEAAAAKLIRRVVRAKEKQDKLDAKAKKKAERSRTSHWRLSRAKPTEQGLELQEKNTRTDNGDSFGNDQDRSHSTDTTRPLRPRRQQTLDLEEGNIPTSDGPPKPNDTSGTNEQEPNDPRAHLERFVPEKKRPHHRLGFLGLWGKKVDTIDWCKEEIARLNKEIDELRSNLGETKPMGSAFIQCNLQLGAHVLAQCVSFHKPLMMTERYIEVAPKDVIWDNIDDGAYETRFRYVTSWMATLGLIILWFVPVAFVGSLSNVSALCEKVSWLCWIRDAPTPIPGIIQGVLPPLFLAILFAILPLILTGLAWYENIPRWSTLYMSVYKRYFLFLVIHGFLVVTLSSGITATATAIISDPTRTVSKLASQLPNASIFFLTWTITQGLSGAGSALLQVGTLLMHFVKKWFLGRTPRQAYSVTFLMPKANFGTVLPSLSLLATIAFAYSVLSPVINGLAMLAFILFFFSWKFLLTWVFDQPDEGETGGLYFPLAINFLFVGLYIEQFCLAALFFLKIADGIGFIIQGIFMLVLMGLTVIAQILFQRMFEPITTFLPMSLATKSLQERWEEQRKKRHLPKEPEGDDGDLDLFSRRRIRSVVRRRIHAPVQKLTKHVEKQVAKTIMPSKKKKNGKDEDDPVVTEKAVQFEDEQPRGKSSAHSLHENVPEQGSRKEKRERVERDNDDHYSCRSGRSRASSLSSLSSSSSDASQPPLPSSDLPPSTLVNEDEEDVDKDFDEFGFDHPSTYTAQPWIWIPKDELGLSEMFVRDFQAAGVEASCVGATMDKKGSVEVQRNPPDEEWVGGHDA